MKKKIDFSKISNCPDPLNRNFGRRSFTLEFLFVEFVKKIEDKGNIKNISLVWYWKYLSSLFWFLLNRNFGQYSLQFLCTTSENINNIYWIIIYWTLFDYIVITRPLNVGIMHT